MNRARIIKDVPEPFDLPSPSDDEIEQADREHEARIEQWRRQRHARLVSNWSEILVEIGADRDDLERPADTLFVCAAILASAREISASIEEETS